MTIQKLAESTMDSLQDNRQSLSEYIAALLDEAKSQAARAARESTDYTTEELAYWEQIRYEAQPDAEKIQEAARDFIWALDKGLFANSAELAESAFVGAIRKAVA